MDWMQIAPWLEEEPSESVQINTFQLLEWMSKNVVNYHGIEPGDREFGADQMIAQQGRIDLANDLLFAMEVMPMPEPQGATGQQLRDYSEGKVKNGDRSRESTGRGTKISQEVAEGT